MRSTVMSVQREGKGENNTKPVTCPCVRDTMIIGGTSHLRLRPITELLRSHSQLTDVSSVSFGTTITHPLHRKTKQRNLPPRPPPKQSSRLLCFRIHGLIPHPPPLLNNNNPRKTCPFPPNVGAPFAPMTTSGRLAPLQNSSPPHVLLPPSSTSMPIPPLLTSHFSTMVPAIPPPPSPHSPPRRPGAQLPPPSAPLSLFSRPFRMALPQLPCSQTHRIFSTGPLSPLIIPIFPNSFKQRPGLPMNKSPPPSATFPPPVPSSSSPISNPIPLAQQPHNLICPIPMTFAAPPPPTFDCPLLLEPIFNSFFFAQRHESTCVAASSVNESLPP